MATTQLGCASTVRVGSRPFEGLRPSMAKVSSMGPQRIAMPQQPFRTRRRCSSLVVKAATAVAPKFTTLKPLGDRVLVKIQAVEEKTEGGILLPSTAITKPQSGEVVAVGEGKTIGKAQVGPTVELGAKVIYSKYAGTDIEFNGVDHLLLKEDDIVGLLETDDMKDLKPLNDRVLIKVQEAETKTAGGVLLSESSKEKPSVGTVIAVGPGSYDGEGNRIELGLSPGNTVLYSKYAGNDFKGKDGSQYIALRASDVIAVLS
uniref:20 kDa chaperonin, chloroplastic n=1 Tax=Araucaria cunninghamii TaxID=56994 RepID=A0A0D6R714_ARACU